MTLHFWSTNKKYKFPKRYDALCGYSDDLDYEKGGLQNNHWTADIKSVECRQCRILLGLERAHHMTVGALIAIMWDPRLRGTFEHAAGTSGESHPLICGLEWKDNIAISQLLIQKDGSVRDEDKITCQGCIAVLKLNGL